MTYMLAAQPKRTTICHDATLIRSIQVSHHIKARSLVSPERAAAMTYMLAAQNRAAYELLNTLLAFKESMPRGTNISGW